MKSVQMLKCALRIKVRLPKYRGYKFGREIETTEALQTFMREKREEKHKLTKLDQEVLERLQSLEEKALLSMQKEINELYNPFISLGLDSGISHAELILKLRSKQIFISKQIDQIELKNSQLNLSSADTTLPAMITENNTQIEEYRLDLRVIEKALETFATVESRAHFENNYDVEVDKIIRKHMTYRQKILLPIVKNKKALTFWAKDLLPTSDKMGMPGKKYEIN